MNWMRPEWAASVAIADEQITLPDFLDHVVGVGVGGDNDIGTAISPDNAFLRKVLQSPSAFFALSVRLDQITHAFMAAKGEATDPETKTLHKSMTRLSNWFQDAGWKTLCDQIEAKYDWFPSNFLEILRAYPPEKPNYSNAVSVSTYVPAQVGRPGAVYSAAAFPPMKSLPPPLVNPSTVPLAQKFKDGDTNPPPAKPAAAYASAALSHDNDDDKKPSAILTSAPTPPATPGGTRFFRKTGTETLELVAPSATIVKGLMEQDHETQMARLNQQRSNDDNRLDKEQRNNNEHHQHQMAQMEKQSSLRQIESDKQFAREQANLSMQLEIEKVKAGSGAQQEQQQQHPTAVTPARTNKRKIPASSKKTPAKTPRTKTISRKLAAMLKKTPMPLAGRDNFQTIDAREGDGNSDLRLMFANRLLPLCPQGKSLKCASHGNQTLQVNAENSYHYFTISCGCAPKGSKVGLKLRCVQVPLKADSFLYALQRPENKPQFCRHYNEDGTQCDDVVRGVDEDVF